MIGEIIRALFQAGLPVGLASYAMVWWALRHEYLGQVESVKDIEREVERLSKIKTGETGTKKSKKEKTVSESEAHDEWLGESLDSFKGLKLDLGSLWSDKKSGNSDDDSEEDAPPEKRLNPVHNKWLAFGGGFYGLVGLLTYAVVEWGEIMEFLSGFESFSDLQAALSIGTLIGLLVDALMNFIVAITWPMYWMRHIDSDAIWVWFVVAYVGYWAGTRLALKHSKREPISTI